MATASRPELKVDWCSHEAARHSVEHWHYSRSLPAGKLVKVGVWEDGSFVGCVLFGRGATPHLLKPYRLAQTEGCELVRIALREHATPVSRIVRIALKFLKRFCPGLRLVISFADPERGHTGSIYQAGGWLYAGMTTPSDEFIVNGKRVHPRSLQSARKSHRRRGVAAGTAFEWARKALDPDARRVKGSSKHRYLMPLDDEMRARIAPLARPYPKRAGSADGGTSPDQGGGGGSNPTPALPPLTQEQ